MPDDDDNFDNGVGDTLVGSGFAEAYSLLPLLTCAGAKGRTDTALY